MSIELKATTSENQNEEQSTSSSPYKEIFTNLRKSHISLEKTSPIRENSLLEKKEMSSFDQESIWVKLKKHNFHIILAFFLLYPFGVVNLKARFWVMNFSCLLGLFGIIYQVITPALLIYLGINYIGIVLFIYLELRDKENFFQILFSTDKEKKGMMKFFTYEYRMARNMSYIFIFTIIGFVCSEIRGFDFAIAVISIMGCLLMIFFVAFVSPWIYNKQLFIFSSQDEDLKNYFTKLDSDSGYKVYLKYYDFRINWNDFKSTFMPLDIAQNISAVVAFVFAFIKVTGLDATLGNGNSFISKLFQGEGFEFAAFFIVGVGVVHIIAKIIISSIRGRERSLSSLKFYNYSTFLKFLTDSPQNILVEGVPMTEEVEFESAWNSKYTYSDSDAVEDKESSEMNYEGDVQIALKNILREKYKIKSAEAKKMPLGKIKDDLQQVAIECNRIIQQIYEDYDELCKIVKYKFFGVITIDYSFLGKVVIGIATTIVAGMMNFIEDENGTNA